MLPPSDTLTHDGPLFFVNVFVPHPPDAVAVTSMDAPAAFVMFEIDPQVSVAPGTVMVNDSSSVFPFPSVTFTVTVGLLHLAEVGTVPVILPPEDTLTHDGPLFFVNVFVPHPPDALDETLIEPPGDAVTSSISSTASASPETVIINDASAVAPCASVAVTVTVKLSQPAVPGTVPVMLPSDATLIHEGVSLPVFFVNATGVHPPVALDETLIEPPGDAVTSSISSTASASPETVIINDASAVAPCASVAVNVTVKLSQPAVPGTVPVMLPSDATLIHEGVSLPVFFVNATGVHPPVALDVILMEPPGDAVTSSISSTASTSLETVIINDASAVAPCASVAVNVTVKLSQPAELGTVPVMLPSDATLIHDGVSLPGFFANVIGVHPPVALDVILMEPPGDAVTSSRSSIASASLETVIANDASAVAPCASVAVTVTVKLSQPAELGTVPVMLPSDATLIHDGVSLPVFFENVIGVHPPLALDVILIEPPGDAGTSSILSTASASPVTVIINDASAVAPCASVAVTVTVKLSQPVELGTVPVMLPSDATLIHDGVSLPVFFENVIGVHPPLALDVILIEPPGDAGTSSILSTASASPVTVIANDASAVAPCASVAVTVTVKLSQPVELGTVPVMLPSDATLIHDGVSLPVFFENVIGVHPPLALDVILIEPPGDAGTSSILSTASASPVTVIANDASAVAPCASVAVTVTVKLSQPVEAGTVPVMLPSDATLIHDGVSLPVFFENVIGVHPPLALDVILIEPPGDAGTSSILSTASASPVTVIINDASAVAPCASVAVTVTVKLSQPVEAGTVPVMLPSDATLIHDGVSLPVFFENVIGVHPPLALDVILIEPPGDAGTSSILSTASASPVTVIINDASAVAPCASVAVTVTVKLSQPVEAGTVPVMLPSDATLIHDGVSLPVFFENVIGVHPPLALDVILIEPPGDAGTSSISSITSVGQFGSPGVAKATSEEGPTLLPACALTLNRYVVPFVRSVTI